LSEQQASYRQMFKATSLFGGVQVFTILLSILRSKIIAVLLGPVGMGVAGLLTTTILLVGSLTNFGLGISAVKDIAAANGTNDQLRISQVITIVRRLVWITGLFGAIATLVLSSWLSRLTFGNSDYTFAFAWLSVTLIFNQLTSGQDVLLQGMRKLNHLAKANMAGSFFGLLVSIPLYYSYGINGIVPALIASAFLNMLIAWYFARQIIVEPVVLSAGKTYQEGREMLRMGIMLSLNSVITLGASYVVRMYISKTGGIGDVGLYSAGFAIISTYVGLIFTAMAADYYPRLAGISNDKAQAGELINNQAELALLILAPILCIFLVFIKLVVAILYSKQFTPVNGMIHWAALGMFFKAASWPIGFLFLAKGDSKNFFWNELIANIYLLAFNILGYKFYGLNGMGISFLAGYAVYLLQVYVVTGRMYAFELQTRFIVIFGKQFALGFLCFLLVTFAPALWAYIIGSLVIAVSAGFSIFEMDKRLDLRGVVNKFRRK
jgi:O-antigen/teichoic acid export membrane protein